MCAVNGGAQLVNNALVGLGKAQFTYTGASCNYPSEQLPSLRFSTVSTQFLGYSHEFFSSCSNRSCMLCGSQMVSAAHMQGQLLGAGLPAAAIGNQALCTQAGGRVDAGAVRRDLPAGLHAAWGKPGRPPPCGRSRGASTSSLWGSCRCASPPCRWAHRCGCHAQCMVCACARPVSAYQPSLRVLTPSLPHTWHGKVSPSLGSLGMDVP